MATVAVILAVRAQYLAAGASPLKHWDQIQDRVRAAAATSRDVATWTTSLARSLGLGAPDSNRSSATSRLARVVEEDATSDRWLDLVEEEHAYLMALARLEAERRQEERKRARSATLAADPIYHEED